MKKISKALAFSLAVFMTILLSGCSIQINIGNKNKETDPTVPTSVVEPPSAGESVDAPSSEENPEITIPTSSSPIVNLANAREIKVSKALKVYRKAAQAIKDESIGFKKIQWQDFNEINTADKTGIADMVLTIVSKNVIKNNTREKAEQNYTVIPSGDSAAVTREFPLFNNSAAFLENGDDSFITGAEYAKTDNYTEYILYFAPAVNPAMGASGFGSIMTPFDRESILTAIKNYAWNVKVDSLKLDCTYTNSYVDFRVDKKGRLLQLEMHMYGEIDAKAEVDLIIASTNFLNGKCKYEEHYIYNNFDYPQQ